MIKLGLTGHPLAHSLSPRIHQAALDHCALEGSYSLFPIPPDDPQALRELLEKFRSGEINGLNVTIPYKQTVMNWLDALTPAAQAIGAVNTIYIQGGKLTGDNTDAPGFFTDLNKFFDQQGIAVKTAKNALLLGAGGAARAVAYALLTDGWKLTIAARRAEQMQALKDQFPQYANHINCIALAAPALENIADDPSLVVNATPLGMAPLVERSPWPDDLSLPQGAVVYDLVYNPHETRLARKARESGLPSLCGLGMLVEQAALAFEIWTGCPAPRESLYSVVEEQ